MAVSLGVNVTLTLLVPAFGAVEGVVNAKLPATLAVPPLRAESLSVCPYVIALADGPALITGVAWAIVNTKAEDVAPS